MLLVYRVSSSSVCCRLVSSGSDADSSLAVAVMTAVEQWLRCSGVEDDSGHAVAVSDGRCPGTFLSKLMLARGAFCQWFLFRMQLVMLL